MTPVIPCPVLVGRAAELDVLLAALDAALQGDGSVVYVVGEAGIGKSRLAEDVRAAAAARGALVLRGRAVPGSGASAFRPLTEALAPIAADLHGDDLGPWLPALGGVVPTAGVPPTSADVSPAVRGEAVLRALGHACGSSGGLVVLEDLHWADPETIAIVEHLTDNLARVGVLLLATVRAGERGAADDLVRDVSARRSAPVLRLARLNRAQIAAMVHSCTGRTDDAAVDRLVALSDGVPFLVEELLTSPGLPSSLAEVVGARLGEIDEPARQVLVTASAYGRHFDWRLLAAATGQSELEVVEALEHGVAAQLLAVEADGFRFRHALTADAVFHSVSPPRREAFASAALAALDAEHPDLPPMLREVAARVAERAGQSERAGRLLAAAGDDALAHGALHTAVAALERATQLLDAGDASDRASESLLAALALMGRVDRALAIGQALAERLAPERAAHIHLRLAGAAVTASRWDVAAAELEVARPLVESAGSPALVAELFLREAELAIDTSDPDRADERARAALDRARRERLGEIECAALQLLGRCARRTSLSAAEARFREALDVAEAHDLALWRLRALHELGTIALLERSEVDALLEARTVAESLGAMATLAVLDVEIAAGYAGLHDLDAEARHGMDAARRGEALGLAMVAAHGWLHVAGAVGLRGDGERLAEAAAAAHAAAPAGNRDVEGLLIGACEVHAALVADDTELALDAAHRSTEILRGSQTAPPAHFRAAWPLLLAVQRRTEAPAALEEMEATGVSVSGAGRGCLEMARAVITGWTDPDAAVELAVRADGALRFTPLWRHLVRRQAAEAARRDGWSVPEPWLVEAERWCRDHGYRPVADACRALRLGETSPVPPAWRRMGVSRRESDVLHLVVDGLSNREIAERLHLSVRTVEKHVEALLRKTATKSRTQLARAATTT